MSFDLTFVLQTAASGVRAKARINGFVVAYTAGPAPFASTRNVKTYLVRGKNAFDLEATLVEKPRRVSSDGSSEEEPYLLDLTLHALGPGAPLSDVTMQMRYGLTENELPPGDGPHKVLAYTLPLGSDAEGPRAWMEAAEIRPEDVEAVTRQGLAACRAALDRRDAATLSDLVSAHAIDHAAVVGIDAAEAAVELLGDVLPFVAAPGCTVDVAPDGDVELDVLMGGKVVQARTRSGGPALTVRSGAQALGLYPSFSMLQGRARVVRWS